MGVGAGGERNRLQATSRVGRQRNAAAHRQAFHQHTPALTGHFRPADNVIDRHKDIVAARRPVLERHVEREVAAADFNTWRVCRDQRAGNAELLLAAQQAIRVREFKREAQHRSDRRERNVALVPGEAHAEHLLALPFAHADHAGIRNGARIGARFRAGQREAGDFHATRQARQVVVLLRVGAVVLQQFARAEGVWHAHSDGENAGDAGEFLQHAGLRVSRELQTAVLFFDDHREEAMLFQERPQLRRQIRHFVGYLEVIRHAARFFHRAVKKRLLFGGQLRLRVVMQLLPVRVAAEQIAFPPGRPGVDRFFLRARHRRHHFTKAAEHGRGDQRFTHWRNVQRHQNNRQRHQQPQRPEADGAQGGGPGEQDQAAERQADAMVKQRTDQNEGGNDTQDHHKEKLPCL
ncbi:hypothetical protein BN136_585 [Cronobacter universalis NCTC 9529]|nr:hypothetical protein BN136_585 [Cronobacter universalis NCTC 9529]